MVNVWYNRCILEISRKIRGVSKMTEEEVQQKLQELHDMYVDE